MSTLADYAGRAYDVSAFRGVRGSGPALLDQSLAGPGDPGEVCTGIQKLAQQFAIELLTEQGSVLGDPTRGTTLMTKLRQGRLRTDLDVFVAFNFAVGDLAAAFRRDLPAGAPPDEQLASATLEAVAVSPGMASLRVALTSKAGSSRAVILPIRTTP